MATQGVSLPLAPAALLCALPARAGTFLLDGGTPLSWGSGEALLGCEPSAVVTGYATGVVRIVADGAVRWLRDDPFAVLDRLVASGVAVSNGPPAPAGGVVCALGYDLGRWVERLPDAPVDDLGLPVLFAAVHPWVLAYSYQDAQYTLRSHQLSATDLDRVARRLRRVARRPSPRSASQSPVTAITSNFTRASYRQAIRRALDYIAAGDIYQVNLAQRFTAAPVESPRRLFRRLLGRHPMPYAAFVDGGAWALVSNSPECFLRRDGDRVATLPIKGTRPRGASAVADDRLQAELVASVKDRAEHLMIVDLERNDLGRICRCGSVVAPPQPTVRSFPSLHHLESEVTGRLESGTSFRDILCAIFPGGSITGAPKIRAMEIIDELEPVARRFYTGAIGFADGAEWARFNVAIRTAVVTRSAVAYHTGGGIVADSRPDDEYDETLLKAHAFLAALRGAPGT